MNRSTGRRTKIFCVLFPLVQLFGQTGQQVTISEQALAEPPPNNAPADTIPAGDHDLDNQFVLVGRLSKILFMPPNSKTTFLPQFYYKSNYFSKKIWGGKIGTGMTVGLNYILFPYMAFTPEWRKKHVFVSVSLGGQLGISGSLYGAGAVIVPFGSITAGVTHPLSKKIAFKVEAGFDKIILPGYSFPIYSNLNVGFVYRRSSPD